MNRAPSMTSVITCIERLYSIRNGNSVSRVVPKSFLVMRRMFSGYHQSKCQPLLFVGVNTDLLQYHCSPFYMFVLLAAIVFGAVVTSRVQRKKNERINSQAIEAESTRLQHIQRIKLLERKVSQYNTQASKNNQIINQHRAQIAYEMN